MRSFHFILLTCVALTAWGGNAAEREGNYWVRSGHTEPARVSQAVKRLEIFTRANVIVRASADGTLAIRLRQRVQAGSAEEADRMWGPMTRLGPFVAAGNTLRLDLFPPGVERVISDLEISVPTQLAMVWVNNRSGRVEVTDLDGNVQVDTGGGPLVLDRIGGSVRVHTGFGEIRLGVIGGSVECSSGGGSITLARSAGGMNCITGGGDIGVQSAGGSVIVSTEGGNVRVEQSGGSVQARSLAGLIEVGQAGGAVVADSGGGSIRVKGGSGPMTVSAMVGHILAELMAGARLGNSSLTAEAGDITVMIPAGFGLAVRARNDSGGTPRVVSDFPELQMKSVGFRAPAGGSINGGGPVLDLMTNGAVYLKRVK